MRGSVRQTTVATPVRSASASMFASVARATVPMNGALFTPAGSSGSWRMPHSIPYGNSVPGYAISRSSLARSNASPTEGCWSRSCPESSPSTRGDGGPAGIAGCWRAANRSRTSVR